MRGKIKKIEGDIQHPYTKGKLCGKGQLLLQKIYSDKRILQPLQQVKRGSNQWKKISWDKALNIIVEKILDIKIRYHNLLPIFAESNSGNIGCIAKTTQLFLESLGPVTKFGNVMCDSAGLDAHFYIFGQPRNSSPFLMEEAKLIIIWGGNPAWTSPHQMDIILKARKKGARIIVIDPIITATSSIADKHISVHVGFDGALVLGMIKHIIEENLYDKDFIQSYVLGWDKFKIYIESKVSMKNCVEISGVSEEDIRALAQEYALTKHSVIWQGMGGQRHVNGGQNYRIINTLAAITGNMGFSGSGVYYLDYRSLFSLDKVLQKNIDLHQCRSINIIDFEKKIDPPLEMAFIVASNPLAQFPNASLFREILKKMELVVVVDHFLTQTTTYADIVLPATTFFERPDICGNYWHGMIGYNQRAIRPLGESKSEFKIAHELAVNLKALLPKDSPFLQFSTEEDFLEETMLDLVENELKLNNYHDFTQGGYYRPSQFGEIAWQDKKFLTKSGKIELSSSKAQKDGLPYLPVFTPPFTCIDIYPYQLLTVHACLALNSQFSNLDLIEKILGKPKVLINKNLAEVLKIEKGQKIKLYNQKGEVEMIAEITSTVPENILVCYQGEQMGKFSINAITNNLLTDMGGNIEMYKGVAYHDTFINISKV